MRSLGELKELLKAEALRLGFVAIGVAKAEPVPEEVRQHYCRLIPEKGVGDMTYLLRNEDVRFDPRKLVEGAKSIIVLAFNYYPPIKQKEGVPQVAFFAYGKDYHRVLKDKLFRLLEMLKQESGRDFKARPFVDSAPLLERYWAMRAGIGRIGRNGLLIVPRYGSFCFLAEIVTTLEFPPDDPQESSPCGRCFRCVEACPAGAILSEGGILPTKCLSYQTIEHKGNLPEGVEETLGDHIFGCDICQKVCPHNAKAKPHQEKEFLIPDKLRTMQADDWRSMSKEEFDALFEGSPLLRSGYKGILRNLESIHRSEHSLSEEPLTASVNEKSHFDSGIYPVEE